MLISPLFVLPIFNDLQLRSPVHTGTQRDAQANSTRLLQTQEFIGIGTQGDAEAAHTGTQCDAQANSTGLLQKHEFIGTGTQGDLQARSSDIQGDLQAGTSTDVAPCTHHSCHHPSILQ